MVTHSPDPVAPDAATVNRRARFAASRLLAGDTQPGWKSSLDRVAGCGRRLVAGSDHVQLRATIVDGKRVGGFAGVAYCGSVWACPCCASKVLATRQLEIQAAVEGWAGRGRVAFFTYTVRHDARMSATEVWDGVQAGHHAITSGRVHQGEKDRMGVPVGAEITSCSFKTSHDERVVCPVASCGEDSPRGRRHAAKGCHHGELTKRAQRHARVCRLGMAESYVLPWTRVVEVTLGDNGWHVHQHMLVFLPEGTTDEERDELYTIWWRRWRDGSASAGLDGALMVNRAQWVDRALDVSRYVTKGIYETVPEKYTPAERAGFEVGRGDLKTGRFGNRSAMELLRDVVTNRDPSDLGLWLEYEQASVGRRQMTWAHGARDLLLPDVEELTDEEIAEQELGSQEDAVADIRLSSFRRDVLEPLGRRAELLEAVERDASAAIDLLILWGVEWRVPLPKEKSRPVDYPDRDFGDY